MLSRFQTKQSTRFQFSSYEASGINPVTAVISSLACTDIAENLSIPGNIPLRNQTLDTSQLTRKLTNTFLQSSLIVNSEVDSLSIRVLK